MKIISLLAINILVFSSSSYAKISIKLSEDLPRSHANLIKNDLSRLDRMKFLKPVDNETLKVMGLKKLNKVSAKKWVEARVEYILEAMDFSTFYNQVLILEKNYKYQNQDLIPIRFNKLATIGPFPHT